MGLEINTDTQRTFKNLNVNQFISEERTNNKEKKYPGVTRVLSATDSEDKKASLERWRKRIGEENADRILATANAQGSAVDKMVDDYLANKDIKTIVAEIEEKYGNNPNCDLEIVSRHFNGIRSVLDDTDKFGDLVHGTQVKLISDSLKLCGYADVIGFYNGKMSVIDIKTSRKTKKPAWIENYYLQETAYAKMYTELIAWKIEQIVTIMAVEEFQPVSGYSYVDIFIDDVSNWETQLQQRIDKYYEELE